MDKDCIDILDRIKNGIITWYDFRPSSSILRLDRDNVFIPTGEKYDYIIYLDADKNYPEIKRRVKDILGNLKEDGVLLLTFNNRLGIRYFCGDTPEGHMYTKAEIRQLLTAAGLTNMKFYSVFSDLNNPSHIFAEDYIPNEDIANRFFPTYNTPETVFMREEELYRDLIDNGLLHSVANAYLVEAAKSDSVVLSDVLQVTSTLDRDEDNSFLTVIHGDNTVIKMNPYGKGEDRFNSMLSCAGDLKDHGIDVVDMRITSEGLSMPYINAPTGQLALRKALFRDKDAFLKMMDDFRDCIMKSSEIIEEDNELGPIARYGYIDMVPLNSLYVDGKFLFFDQEFRREKYPFNAIVFRMIATFYFGNDDLKMILDPNELYERYGILAIRDRLRRMEAEFLSSLRNEEALREYHAGIRRNNAMTAKNHEKMRMSADAYLEKYRNDSPRGTKPYHIGYVAGAFDMFHIGHLNLLRRAKERCDYLVAGVIADERVYELKHRNPVIPCAERMKIVEGCRYVDEVIELPLGKALIRDAYERVRFDCMFSGDDHANNPGWLAEQEYLRARGSDIVFVSYTKETSTTDIRKKVSLESSLLTDRNHKWIYTYDYAPDSIWEPWRETIHRNNGVPVENKAQLPAPMWIKEEVSSVVTRIKEGLPSFILLADSHFTYNGTWEDTLASMKALSEKTKISGIIHLGDMSDGLLPLAKTREIEDKCVSDMESIGAPVYLVPGNHDYNYFRGNPEIKYPDNPQFYVDIADRKMRFIFIDSFDPKEESRYGFSEKCIKWLDEILGSIPEGYSSLIFSHLTPLVRLQAWTKDIRNRVKLIEVLDKHADIIMAFINGHNHCDHLFNDLHNGQFPIISINCAKCEYFTDHKPVGAVVPERRLGDRTQESFDVMQIDTDKKEIYFTRFGAGKDRIVKDHKAVWRADHD